MFWISVCLGWEFTPPTFHPPAAPPPPRSLKLYFLLRMYGAEFIRAYLRHHIALAAAFAQRVDADPRFELAAPQRFGLVCFRYGVPSRL